MYCAQKGRDKRLRRTSSPLVKHAPTRGSRKIMSKSRRWFNAWNHHVVVGAYPNAFLQNYFLLSFWTLFLKSRQHGKLAGHHASWTETSYTTGSLPCTSERSDLAGDLNTQTGPVDALQRPDLLSCHQSHVYYHKNAGTVL